MSEDKFIEHSEICAMTAKKMGVGSDQVDKTVTNYVDQMIKLMKEKRPTSTKEKTIVSTPLFSAQLMLENEKIVAENGKKYKVSQQYRIRYGIAEAVFKAINDGLEVTKTLIDEKDGKVKTSSVKAA